MRNKIGVMQGRLLPKVKGRYQAHPVDQWHKEFGIAKALELDLIEFIVDFDNVDTNPLVYDGGVTDVLKHVSESGVNIQTICVDYFLDAPIHTVNESCVSKGLEILNHLITCSKHLGVTDIVIPCIDGSALNSGKKIDLFIDRIQKIIPCAEAIGVNLSLETDLDPWKFSKVLNTIDSTRVTVNYDIGNSAALGYNPVDEFEAYGSRISNVHIKDRMLSAQSVPLGTGNANFELVFQCLSEIDYRGPLIMQAYRDEEGISIFKKQLNWVKPYLDQLNG